MTLFLLSFGDRKKEETDRKNLTLFRSPNLGKINKWRLKRPGAAGTV